MFKIITYKKLSSTNKFALENINKFEADTVIRAIIQEQGRGRFERKWISDKPDNCYISFVLKPNIKFRKNFPNLTQYLSIALCNTFEKYDIVPNIKWPNDVLVNGKKIAGILSEASFCQNNFNGIILGIGVNLNLAKEDLTLIDKPSTSLNLEISKKINSDKFIQELCENFYIGYEKLIQNGFADFREDYLKRCDFIGKEIVIKNPEAKVSGIAKNICDDGTLEILLTNGEVKKIISGDLLCN